MKILKRQKYKHGVDFIIGVLVGTGGFGDVTILGLILWILIEFLYAQNSEIKKGWAKDILFVNIGILLIWYWSFYDPNSLITNTFGFDNGYRYCAMNSYQGLTWQEATKITLLVIFSIVCNHTKAVEVKNVLLGIATGLAFYVIPTLAGSILIQGFRMGGDKIYNIFSNDLSAQSTSIGYLVIMIIALTVALKKSLSGFAILVGIITALQTSNKTVMAYCVLVLIYLISSKLKWRESIIQIRKKRGQSFLLIGSSALLCLLAGTTFGALKARLLVSYSERSELYLQGYSNLLQFIKDPTVNVLTDAGYHFWWHSVPLDAARAAGTVGGATALIWGMLLIYSLIVFGMKGKCQLCLVSIACSIQFFTSMPLHIGAYELISLLAGTILIIKMLGSNAQTE